MSFHLSFLQFSVPVKKRASRRRRVRHRCRSAQRKKNPLGTIISPYYGVGELEEFEAKAQEKIEEKEKLKKEELPQQEVEKYDLEEEINSVPLEDMIEKTPGEDGDDLMQISLFGESTPISSVDDASDKE